ncbi:MAG: cbb3-type cytochrome c oxidase subunit 3 [Alphaproteobacteria bacterium]|nr:MAG: cbb3-type cytochrome c oxidase subunit 3 [Alphaproteobacteria bacterium]
MEYQELAHFSETWGLVILLTMFLGGVVYALWPSNKSKFEKAAQLPLNDDVEAHQ